MPYVCIGKHEIELIAKGRAQEELERIVKVVAYFEKNPLKPILLDKPIKQSPKLASVSNMRRAAS